VAKQAWDVVIRCTVLLGSHEEVPSAWNWTLMLQNNGTLHLEEKAEILSCNKTEFMPDMDA
jgi:hypothetical protein